MNDWADDMGLSPAEQARLDAVYALLNGPRKPPPPPKPDVTVTVTVEVAA